MDDDDGSPKAIPESPTGDHPLFLVLTHLPLCLELDDCGEASWEMQLLMPCGVRLGLGGPSNPGVVRHLWVCATCRNLLTAGAAGGP